MLSCALELVSIGHFPVSLVSSGLVSGSWQAKALKDGTDGQECPSYKRLGSP
jgi:hypothetical protein